MPATQTENSDHSLSGTRRSDTQTTPRFAGAGALWLGFAIVVYLALSIANGFVWEASHDEGGTSFVSLGELPDLAVPAPIESVYASVDHLGPDGYSEVFKRLMLPGGMHPPTYYLLTHAWAGTFGIDQTVRRIPGYLFGVLSLLAIYRLTGQLSASDRYRRWVVVLFAVSPWLMGFSNFLRPYAMALAIALWSTSALVSWGAVSGRARWAALFVGLSLLGILSIYPYLFVLAWQMALLALLALRVPPPASLKRLYPVILAGLAIIVGYLPWLPSLGHQVAVGSGFKADWYFSGVVSLAEWPVKLAKLLHVFALGEAHRIAVSNELKLALYVLSVATLAGLFLGARARKPLPDLTRIFWLSVPIMPLLVIASDLLFENQTFFVSKQNFFLLPLLVLAIVGVCHRMRFQRLAAGLLAAWSVLGLSASASVILSSNASQTDFESLAQFIDHYDDPSHLVILGTTNYAYDRALLVALREQNVQNVRVARAGPKTLWRSTRSWLEDPSIERVTLVKFQIPYYRERLWAEILVNRVSRYAAIKGWHVESRSPDELVEADDPAYTFTVVRQVHVKYFSM